MTPALAVTIIKAQVEAILGNNELFDEYAVAALLKVSPAIGKFIPGDENTIFDRYVMEIDREATKQLESRSSSGRMATSTWRLIRPQ